VAVWAWKYAERSAMSSSVRIMAIGDIRSFLRSPERNAFNWRAT
jgi:hypothetical protein